MIITNTENLPAPLAAAVTRSMTTGYNDAESTASIYPARYPRLRVSTLLKPPRAALLERELEARNELKQSAEDAIYALLGSVVHRIIAEYSDNVLLLDHLIETRMEGVFRGWSDDPDDCFVVTGRPDSLCLTDGTLSDWKLASVWEQAFGVNIERQQQLNIYAWLLWLNGYTIKRIQNVFIFRDWSKTKALRDSSHPDKQVMVYPQELWPAEVTTQFIRQRAHPLLRSYDGLQDDPAFPVCTDEERWCRGGRYAVVKDGRKTALGVGNTKEEAMKKAKANNSEKVMSDPSVRVEIRPVDSIRCRHYCYAFPICKQGQQEIANADAGKNA